MRSVLLKALHHLLRWLRPAGKPDAAPVVLYLQYQMPLGCCVHGTPIPRAIKTLRPDATLIVATRGLGYATLQHDPNVDVLLSTSAPLGSLANMWRVAGEIRRELAARKLSPTLILEDGSSKAGSFALFAALLRLAPVASFAQVPELCDYPLAYDTSVSLIENNLRAVSVLGGRTEHIEPAVYFTPAELQRARTLIAEPNPSGAPLVAFVLQGSGGQRTGWYDDRFAAVIRHIESLGCRTVYLGTAADQPHIERIASLAASQGTSLAGRTTIAELAAVLALCDLLITLDTGTLHVGRAVDVPSVILGPSWQKPTEWLPVGKPNTRILRGPDSNVPLDQVPATYKLDEIFPGEVISAAEDLLAQYPPSRSAREARVTNRLSNTRPETR